MSGWSEGRGGSFKTELSRVPKCNNFLSGDCNEGPVDETANRTKGKVVNGD